MSSSSDYTSVSSDSENVSDSSNSSSDVSSSDTDSEVDHREWYLPEFYQEKATKFTLTTWATKKLRRVFLGRPIQKEERNVYQVWNSFIP